jgi:hypothetical protein
MAGLLAYVSPALTFGATYTKGPLDNSPATPFGQGFASFLYGIPSVGHVNDNALFADLCPFYGLFVQDDWRVSRKLMLNLGFAGNMKVLPSSGTTARHASSILRP